MINYKAITLKNEIIIFILIVINFMIFSLGICMDIPKKNTKQKKNELVLEKARIRYFPNGFIPNNFPPLSITNDTHDDVNLIEKRKVDWLRETTKKVNMYLKIHTDLDPVITQHLKNIEVSEGMQKEQVMLIWSKPIRIWQNKIGYFDADEVWEYRIVWYVIHLYFKGDKLTKIIPFESDIMY